MNFITIILIIFGVFSIQKEELFDGGYKVKSIKRNISYKFLIEIEDDYVTIKDKKYDVVYSRTVIRNNPPIKTQTVYMTLSRNNKTYQAIYFKQIHDSYVPAIEHPYFVFYPNKYYRLKYKLRYHKGR